MQGRSVTISISKNISIWQSDLLPPAPLTGGENHYKNQPLLIIARTITNRGLTSSWSLDKCLRRNPPRETAVDRICPERIKTNRPLSFKEFFIFHQGNVFLSESSNDTLAI